ncbi:transposase domain-containing protein [Oribacterium sp. P6A1]|uniref:transposase domain-containing protein n=1 Tax=Oribacterium sp. P6A1 TaxID=1410612 RepID=UPI00241890B9|nr:transposase domain-containing protein [Oribacterium sp. P6A1]
MIYSLAQTAKLNNISVFKYLQTVLLYMPDYINEPEGIEELMPWSDRMQRLCAINKKATVEDGSDNPALFV